MGFDGRYLGTVWGVAYAKEILGTLGPMVQIQKCLGCLGSLHSIQSMNLTFG